jgi:hypothetical protein
MLGGDKSKMMMVPGCNVVGKIVKCGSMKGMEGMGMKEGMMVCGPRCWIARRDSIPSSLRLSLPPVLRGKRKSRPSIPPFLSLSLLPFFPSPHLYFPSSPAS